MSVRFDADAEDYTRVVSLAAQTSWSMCCWVKISVDRDSYSTAWCLDGGATTDYAYLQTSNDGTSMEFHQAGGGSGTGALASRVLAVGVWYFIGVSVNGVNGTMVSKAVGEPSFTVTTWTTGKTSTTHTNLRIGESIFGGEWLNGAVAGVKWWGATLTATELQAEAGQFAPVRTTGLRAYYRFSGPSTTDNSGNGNTLSGGSGTSAEADPSVGPPLPVVRSNTFDGGTAGSAITTGNSGGSSGDAFTSVLGSPQFSNAVAHRGGLVATNSVDGSDTHIDWTNVTQPGTTICGRLYVYVSGAPANTKGLWAVIGPTGVVSKAWIFASGAIGVYVGPADTRVATSGTAIAVGQWMRIEWRYTIDGSGNGTVEMWIYLSADSTVHSDYVISETVAWPGGTPRDVEFHLGRETTWHWYVDEVAVSNTKLGSALPQIVAPVGATTEADAAQHVTARKVRLVGRAASTDAALPIRPVKRRIVGPASDTASVTVIGGRKRRLVGQIIESDVAATARAAHRWIVGKAAETDTAAVIVPDVGAALIPAFETDVAAPIRAVKVRHVESALDGSVAAAVRPAHALSIGLATESGLAQAVGRRKVRIVGRCVDTGHAQPLRQLGRDVTGVDGPQRMWSATLARRQWSADPPARTWSASRT